MSNTPNCYGSMFPDLSRLEYNKPLRGKAVTALVTSLGIGIQSRNLTVDEREWLACQQCPAYRACYDLSMAQLALRQALERL